MSAQVQEKEAATQQEAPEKTQNLELGEAVGRIASGVYIITAQHQDQKAGIIASWVQQAGFEPLTLSIALQPDRELYKIIQQSNTLTINVIESKQYHLMKAFGKFSPNQFENLDVVETGYGITLNEAVASIQCWVKQVVPVSDHHLLVVEAVSGKHQRPELEPMVHLRKSAFNY
jgi:flavin reductase (DIM6/NTAB) family NADH-FMN oxidoreductase RutF